MNCNNHPDVNAEARCTGCSEPFCSNCLVEVKGQKYCAECKSIAVAGAAPAALLGNKVPCELASESLKCALVGILCFGVILGPMAISKGLEAKKQIAANPQLSGSGQATAGIVLGVVVLIFWVLGMVARATTPH